MKFYLAPMEGITGYVYRSAVKKYYGDGIDRYFSPFITYHPKCVLNSHERRDLLPENNTGLNLIPQILTNRSEEFFAVSDYLCSEYGYREFNLNMGCPSGTVVSKGRGAGFLGKPDDLDRFLYEVFSGTDHAVSVKTRLGMTDLSEFDRLMDIYSKYPLAELIIHPRVRKEMYSGEPHRDVFYGSFSKGTFPLCYNGNIYNRADYEDVTGKDGRACAGGRFVAVMCGRGMISDPALIAQLSGRISDSEAQDVHRLKAFHDMVVEGYTEAFQGDTGYVIRKMKEIWTYMIAGFPDSARPFRELCKAQNMSAYMAAVEVIFGSRY